jgi:membrane peptidoglycan carboxypeptidase
VLAYYGGHDGTGLDEAGIYRDPILLKKPDGTPDYDWQGLHHSPGSTFKMYTLATALSQGYGIDSYWLGPSSRDFNGRGLEPDPAHPGQYRKTKATPPVTNSDGDACPGADHYCNLQTALKLSTNTVYYGVGVKVGPDKVIDMAHAMGIQHLWDGNDKRLDLSDKGDGQSTFTGGQAYPSRISPEVAIGQYGITVMDNAAGVATIANGGGHFETHFVQSVSRGGQSVYNEVTKLSNLAQSAKLTRDQVADEQWAMSTVIENSGGVNKLSAGRPAASKTGTWEVCATTNGCPKQYVNQTRDAWYAGFTPDLATVVHIGSNDPNNPVAAYYQGGSKKESVMFGINTPGQIWKKFMDTVLKNKDKSKLLQAKHVAGTKDGEGQSPEPQQPSNPPDAGNGNGNGNGQPCVPPNCQPTFPGQVTASPSRKRPGG